MPRERADFLPRTQLPNLDIAVTAASHERLPLGADSERKNAARMPGEGADFLPGTEIPHLNRAVITATDERLPIRADAQSENPARMPLEGADFLPGWSVLKGEAQFGRRQACLVLLAVLMLFLVVPPTSWSKPASCDLVFVERGVVSFTKPDYQRYGESAGGMFG